jgi:hypothetical protein
MTRLVVPLAFVLVGAGLSRADDKPTWVELFNGKDLTGWVVEGPKEYKDKADVDKSKPNWTVRDGLIRTAGAGLGFLRYDREFSDFILYVEYRMVKEKGVNSGIGIRTTRFDPKQSTATRPSFYSYEVQLLDDADAKPGKGTTGSLYRYVAPAKAAHKPAPEWNAVEIECVGPKIRVNVNGTDTLVFDQSTDEKLKAKPLSGYVCLQSHSKQVEFRNVRIKPLSK